MACNLCGSERQTAVYAMPDRRYFREEFFTVTECDECGLGFVNPRTKLLRKEYRYEDVPMTSKEFRYVNHLQGGLVTALKYAAYSPASVIDRMLWPAIETGQILRRTYGVSTFVGRKL